MTKTPLAVVAAVLMLAGPAAAQDPGRFYGRAEYLSWWIKDGPQSTPLVATGLLNAPSTSGQTSTAQSSRDWHPTPAAR